MLDTSLGGEMLLFYTPNLPLFFFRFRIKKFKPVSGDGLNWECLNLKYKAYPRLGMLLNFEELIDHAEFLEIVRLSIFSVVASS